MGQIILYHLGRLLSYSMIGLAFGLIGKSLFLFGLQQQLSVAVGILMILSVLLPLRSGAGISRIFFRWVGKIKSALGAALKQKTADTFFTIGFLNGFLPCGLVYMAVFAALGTGSTSQGSLYMLMFGLGTLPLMTLAIYFSGMLSSIIKLKLQRLIPFVVVLIGLLFIIRGSGLNIPFLSPAPVQDMVTAEVSCR